MAVTAGSARADYDKRIMKKIVMGLAAGLTLMGGFAFTAAFAEPQALREARIPFVNHGGIRDFRPAGRDVVYLQDRGRQWYRAELMGPCLGLPFARAIGVRTHGSSLDRFGALLVEGQRCHLQSLVAVQAPQRG
jgi:hypothetical protein